MFPSVETLSIVPRLFEDLRIQSRRLQILDAEARDEMLRRHSLFIPNQVAEECIARRYLSVSKVLFDDLTGFEFVHFTGKMFEFKAAGNPERDELSRAKSLLNASIAEGSSHFLENEDVWRLREIVGLKGLEMNGLMKLNGFTLEGLERSGWAIRMY